MTTAAAASSMEVTVHALADAAPQAWRNGGGRTRELLAWPKGDDWRLRISVADVVRDGPFSAFPGVQRWFAVLDGAGVELSFAQVQRVLPGDEAFCFDGGEAPGCRLIDGPTRDLNVMLRGIDGEVRRVVAGTTWHHAAPMRGLFATSAGRWSAGGEQGVDVPAKSLLWCDAAEALAFTFSGTGFWIAAGSR